jgi:hypothetical protein
VGARLYDSGGREVVFSITAGLMIVCLALARARGRELTNPALAPAV